MRALFNESRQSLGSRHLMKKLDLVVNRKKRSVLTTNSKHALTITKSLLNRDFARRQKNQV